METKNNHCVILAGGTGARLWPISTTQKPKQFLDLLDIGKTLIQLAYQRASRIFPKENIWIVTLNKYKDLTQEQLPTLPEENILTEPFQRNTASSIAYASHKIYHTTGEANIVFTPSDHMITDEFRFHDELHNALDFVTQNDVILTIGVKPTRSETEYGYVQVDHAIKYKTISNLFQVKTFTEKPSKEMAQVFVESGEFYWNSGIYITNTKSILEGFSKYLPDIHNLFLSGRHNMCTENEPYFIRKVYAECPNISIDYGIMEKANNVYTLISDIGWSDLGSWNSFHENFEKDEYDNVLNGEMTLTYKTSDSIIHLPKNRRAIIQGLDNYIVVETKDILLVCKKDNEHLIRQFNTDLKLLEEQKEEIF
ncbi:mannose-1-phosphate guanylyltransferase [Halosquirtibacter laminarini]|uniref:Mannose-1-phosphate guanylyltransferase n=1 Tax=Halosquirtibacter laminarini TaxID=3374600 RepID=A0AC61NEZ2_9BACT|nr:mannose-1-phosphate guanylyltransferase [Prolixibacteraceae bacterium]